MLNLGCHMFELQLIMNQNALSTTISEFNSSMEVLAVTAVTTHTYYHLINIILLILIL